MSSGQLSCSFTCTNQSKFALSSINILIAGVLSVVKGVTTTFASFKVRRCFLTVAKDASSANSFQYLPVGQATLEDVIKLCI